MKRYKTDTEKMRKMKEDEKKNKTTAANSTSVSPDLFYGKSNNAKQATSAKV